MNFKEFLFGFSAEEIQTAEQAYKLYYDLWEDEYKRNIVLEKWNQLVLPEVRSALENNDVEAFFEVVSHGHLPISGKACDVAVEGLSAMVPLILNAVQAHKFYDRISSDHWLIMKAVKTKWEELSLAEIEKASIFSVSELKKAAYNTPNEERVIEKLLLKWTNACTSVYDIKDVKEFVQSRSSSWTYEIVDKTIDELLFFHIPRANDIETIKFYYNFAPEGGVAKLMAYEKWLMICITPQEAQEAFRNPPRGKEACSAAAYRRAKELISTAF
jgi:hypothetical protein